MKKYTLIKSPSPYDVEQFLIKYRIKVKLSEGAFNELFSDIGNKKLNETYETFKEDEIEYKNMIFNSLTGGTWGEVDK